MDNNYQIDTLLTHDKASQSSPHGAVVPPIFQNSLFTFDSWQAIDKAFDDKINNPIYSRGHNPTVVATEKKLAILAGSEKAKLFSSGMAAISAGVLHFLKPHGHIITINNIYGPTTTLLNGYLKNKMAVTTTYISGNCITELTNAIQNNTQLIYLESPSSSIFSVQNIKAIAEIAKQHGIATMIDNTWATPIFQKPLALGIDLEMHSCSKYLGGHSDIIAGVLMGNTQLIDAIHQQEFELLGAVVPAMQAWLLLRSLRTLPIRMQQHQHNALKVAEFLAQHEKIALVRYPGLASCSQHELAKQQMTGFSGVMSFQLNTNDLQQVKTFFDQLNLFQIGVSWGGYESLVYAPAISYLKELSPAEFNAMGLSLADIRISVGLEHVDDLIEDLKQALAVVKGK